MVFFISNLMSLVDPELEGLNENEREEFIFLFFQNAGLIESIKCEQSGDRWELTDKVYEAIDRMPQCGENYISMALDCLSRREVFSADDKWRYFATSLATIFSNEAERFFWWLDATVNTIKIAPEHFRLKELSEEHEATGVQFALEVLRVAAVERSFYHYRSHTNQPSGVVRRDH